MKRWLFNIATAVSLLLWLGVLSLFIASYHREILFGENRDGPHMHSQGTIFTTQAGYIHFLEAPRISDDLKSQMTDMHHESWVIRWMKEPDRPGITSIGRSTLGPIQFLGGGFTRRGGTVAPLWMPLLALAVLPGLWLICWILHRRKIVPGHCRVCGYDLRATPERCPECGTAAFKPS